MTENLTENFLTENLLIRMDIKLKAQLEYYSKLQDKGNISKTARKALQKFFEEQKDLK
jgi:hypothetical protein